MVGTFLSIRFVHLAQGAICLASGARAYRRPRLAGLLLGLSVAETAWLAKRSIEQDRLGTEVAVVDTVFGGLGLAAMSAATQPRDRTGSLNWMLPYSVGSTLLGGAGMPRSAGLSAATGLALLYAGSVRIGVDPGDYRSATALANSLSYWGFYVVADRAVSLVRRISKELDDSKQREIDDAARFSRQEERARQHRLLHDSALQTLEAVAAGWVGDDGVIRNRARTDAARLRAALSGADDAVLGDLEAQLEELVAEFAGLGLSVELVQDIEAEPGAEIRSAILDATREALMNVAKHSRVSKAVVRLVVGDSGLEVTVRDQGIGFDPAFTRPGFGLSHSVMARLEDVGGRAELWSAPGRGTRITLRVPM